MTVVVTMRSRLALVKETVAGWTIVVDPRRLERGPHAERTAELVAARRRGLVTCNLND